MYTYMYTCINSVHIIVLWYLLADNCCVHCPIKRAMYSSDNFHPSLICITITYLHKQKIVGEWLIMSLPVLIAQTECKSSANSLHLYELLFPLSSLRQEAAIHSASLVYLHYVDPHTILPLLFIKKTHV